MFTRRTDISSTVSTIPPSQIGRNPCLTHVATQWKHLQITITLQEHQIVTTVALWDKHSLDPWGSAHHKIWNAMLRFRNIPSPEIFLRCDTCPQYLGEGHKRGIVSWCNPPDKLVCTAHTNLTKVLAEQCVQLAEQTVNFFMVIVKAHGKVLQQQLVVWLKDVQGFERTNQSTRCVELELGGPHQLPQTKNHARCAPCVEGSGTIVPTNHKTHEVSGHKSQR